MQGVKKKKRQRDHSQLLWPTSHWTTAAVLPDSRARARGGEREEKQREKRSEQKSEKAEHRQTTQGTEAAVLNQAQMFHTGDTCARLQDSLIKKGTQCTKSVSWKKKEEERWGREKLFHRDTRVLIHCPAQRNRWRNSRGAMLQEEFGLSQTSLSLWTGLAVIQSLPRISPFLFYTRHGQTIAILLIVSRS